MSEAFGTVVIKAPKAIVSNLCKDDESVPWAAISQLLEFAGVDTTKGQLTSLYVNEDNTFFHEGIEHSDGLAIITIFGEQWMYLMEALVKQGSSIEAYGEIHHEHGTVGFFALSGDGKMFCQLIDYEDDDEPEDEEEVREAWAQLQSDKVAAYFEEPEEDDEDDSDSRFDESGWVPIDQCLTETVRARDKTEYIIVHSEIYHHPKYDRRKLQEAIQRGGSLVDPTRSVIGARENLGCSLLNLLITDPEIESYAHRKRVIEDILSLDLLDLNMAYSGYDAVGTPLYLAADEGLYEIVEMLLDRVEDKNPAHPWRNDGQTALGAAKFCRNLPPEEGRDYPKVIELLEQAS